MKHQKWQPVTLEWSVFSVIYLPKGKVTAGCRHFGIVYGVSDFLLPLFFLNTFYIYVLSRVIKHISSQFRVNVS